MSEFLSNVEQTVLSAEENPSRFERFCVEVLSAVEGGAAVVPTSAVWDRGRDGRGIGALTGLFVCSSLRDDVDAKSIEDVERLSQTTRQVTRLYFCSSQPLTEHRSDQMAASIAEYFPASTAVVVLGSKQLADLGRRHDGILERLYGGEIKDVLSRLEREPDGAEELQGLRLALLSTGAEDSVAIREMVYRNAILDTLLDGSGKTLEKIAIDLSGMLRLGRPVESVGLVPYLKGLQAEGAVVDIARGVYAISEAGRSLVDSTKSESAASFVEGRNAIRRVFEEAVGSPILDDDFMRMWGVFEERLTYYLQSRGEQIVAEVSMIFGDASAAESPSTDQSNSLSFLDDLAAAVAATTRHAERQEAIRQAVKDLFADRTGDAAKWLVSVCAAFITACTMGLEYRSGEVVRSLMRRMALVLDTDVVLSLMAEGEPDHVAVTTIVKKWRQNKGKVLVATPVLQEVAYHASIADNDFGQVKFRLPGSEEYRLRIVENAFVRAFASLMANDSAVKLQHWRAYISQFRGISEYDYSRVFEYLASEHGVSRLPDRDAIQASEVESVKRFLLDLVESQKLRVGKNERDKASRDAELYVSLVSHLSRLRDADPDSSCLLISSARRIASVDDEFRLSGEGRLVLSTSAALFLVSTLPTVSLGLSALKSFLFEDRRSRFTSDFERTVLRMVSSSREHSAFVFSRRGLLMRELKSRLVSRAETVGGAPHRQDLFEVEKTALKPANREMLVDTLAEALDAVSGNSRTDKRLKEALTELAEVRRQLELERSRGKQKVKKVPRS